jgi:pilus assembly protein CpaE
VAITVSLVGSRDRALEERLQAAGMRPTSLSLSDLASLAHPSSLPPDVVVLDLRSQSEIPPILGALKRQHPDIGLIIVATTLDPALMLEAMRAGVTECITEIDRGDLEAAINRLVAQRVAPVAGEVFVFLGAKGGVGTTTAAVNIATALAKIGSTLVIDLHLAGGDAALFLGTDSHFSVIDALENTHRLDAAFFRGLVAHTKAGPDLLASADRAALTSVDPPRVRTLIEFAAHHYRYTVIDIPRSDAAVLDSLEGAATIVIVANQELATIRSAGRVASAMRQRYGKDKVAVVLSRSDRQAEIGLDDLKGAVGGPIKYVFPSDYRLAVGALNRGQPLVIEGKTALASAFQAFARELAGAKAAPSDDGASAKAGGFLGRLTGRRS